MAPACGGAAKHYDVGPSEMCILSRTSLVKGLSEDEEDVDVIAAKADKGHVYVAFRSGNTLDIAFERTTSYAANTAAAYRRQRNGLSPPPRLVERVENVVLAWREPPDPADRDVVERCLLTASERPPDVNASP